MNRRILLKHLFPAFGVSFGLGGAAAAAEPSLVAAPAPDPMLPVPDPSVPEPWLEHWLRSAHCLKREAPRTFRLERMELAGG